MWNVECPRKHYPKTLYTKITYTEKVVVDFKPNRDDIWLYTAIYAINSEGQYHALVKHSVVKLHKFVDQYRPYFSNRKLIA